MNNQTEKGELSKINNADLFLGNCLEILPNIPDKSVDTVLCDLP